MGKKRGRLGRDIRSGKVRLIGGADLMTYAQAAKFLGIAEVTLHSWVERGTEDVPLIRLGRLVRFRRASLERWLESRERGSSHFLPQTSVTELEAR